ncbi:hypothetical protein [Methanosarcina sp. MTP4]|uniref:hypothetical protein n=1 Tax=Methanosarcina sp. MTP4 TaxID=1434100 RepID=UPI000A83B4D9|nr:hypothetical protein [Methanosarcina sp. MTP4]
MKNEGFSRAPSSGPASLFFYISPAAPQANDSILPSSPNYTGETTRNINLNTDSYPESSTIFYE